MQSVAVSLRGADFEGLLGLGIIETSEELEREVLARVLDAFDLNGAPNAQSGAAAVTSADVPSDALSYYLRDGFEPTMLERGAGMPLANRSVDRDAGLLFSDLLAHEWFHSAGVDVVERSELPDFGL